MHVLLSLGATPAVLSIIETGLSTYKRMEPTPSSVARASLPASGSSSCLTFGYNALYRGTRRRIMKILVLGGTLFLGATSFKRP